MTNRKARASILFLDQFSGVGGGQRFLFDIVKRAKVLGIPHAVWLPHSGRLVEQLKSEGVIVETIKVPAMSLGAKNFLDVLKMFTLSFSLFFKFFKMRKFDVFYVNGPRLFIPMMLLSLSVLRDKKFVYHLHLDHSPLEKKIISFLEKRSSTLFVFCNSEYTKEQLIHFYPGIQNSNRVKVLGLGLRVGGAEEFDDRFSASDSRFRFACIGRVSQQKGQDLFSELAKDYPQHKFYILGDSDFSDGGFFESLKESKPSNLFFQASVDSVPLWINSVRPHFSVIPSRAKESFGLVAIESMASSCLTIARGEGGLKSIAEKTGLVCFEGDEGLTRLVAKLVSLPVQELGKLAQSQFSKVHASFSSAIYEKALDAALAEISRLRGV